MKFIEIAIIGLIMFNLSMIATEAMGVFPGDLYQGKEVDTDNYQNFSQMGAWDLVVNSIGGINPLSIIGGVTVFALCAMAAWAVKSPVPLGIGGFAAFCTGMLMQTYTTLEQFPIPSYFLAMGTVGLGILMVIEVYSMAAMRVG